MWLFSQNQTYTAGKTVKIKPTQLCKFFPMLQPTQNFLLLEWVFRWTIEFIVMLAVFGGQVCAFVPLKCFWVIASNNHWLLWQCVGQKTYTGILIQSASISNLIWFLIMILHLVNSKLRFTIFTNYNNWTDEQRRKSRHWYIYSLLCWNIRLLAHLMRPISLTHTKKTPVTWWQTSNI